MAHNVEQCPHCSVHIVPKTDGMCPNCQRNINDQPEVSNCAESLFHYVLPVLIVTSAILVLIDFFVIDLFDWLWHQVGLLLGLVYLAAPVLALFLVVFSKVRSLYKTLDNSRRLGEGIEKRVREWEESERMTDEEYYAQRDKI